MISARRLHAIDSACVHADACVRACLCVQQCTVALFLTFMKTSMTGSGLILASFSLLDNSESISTVGQIIENDSFVLHIHKPFECTVKNSMEGGKESSSTK